MKNTSTFARLWSYLKVYKFAVAFAIFLKILSVVMSVVEPFVLGLAITELTINLLDMAKGVAGAQINVSYVGWVMVLYFVRAIFYEIGSYYSNYFMTNAVQATIRDLRDELSHKINCIPVSYFDKHQFGDLLGRFTSDVEAVSNALQQSFLQVINAVFTLILVIVMVLVLNLQLGIIVVVSIPITYLSARFIVKKSQPYFKQQADALGAMNGFVQENLTGFNILKLYVREESSQEDFRQITQNLQKVGFKASFISGLMMPVLNVISDLTYLLLALLGGLQVIAGRLTVGNMQAFVQYVWQINQPIQNLAIVGPTGAGKTTLINLLMRFYDVTKGAITVDGNDIRHLSRQDYRKQFGMVLQDAWLYEGTIKENLRFGNLQATDEEIVEAAKAANVDHFIRTLPGGYNMEMNQESSNISLGQKQLLTIARALLANPKILILDEATSSVDTRLELLIQKAMKTLMQGRTSFVIAHRLSTIQEADKILVLKDGQIIEQGNHESLLADKGFYYDLYQSQFSKKAEEA